MGITTMNNKPWMFITTARWKVNEKDSFKHGIAILREPGAYDVIAFVAPDGTTVTEVFRYHLDFQIGSMTIPV